MTIVPQTQVEPLVSRASGSAANFTWGHNQYGPWTRKRQTPPDPSTPEQQVVRHAMTLLSDRWARTLTSVQRLAWDCYALAVALKSPLGRATNAGGLPHYIRSNVPRIQANEVALPTIDDAPTLLNLPPLTPIVRVVMNPTDDTFHPFFSLQDPWTETAGSALLFYVSRPQPLTVNFFKGPYRFAGSLLGNDPTLTSPATIGLRFAALANERVFVRLRLSDADARLTSSCHLQADIAPQVNPVATHATFIPGSPTAAQVVVYFDTYIRDEPHLATNWQVRYQGERWTTALAVTEGSTIRLTLITPVPTPPADWVQYRPMPGDVWALLTGFPAIPFRLNF